MGRSTKRRGNYITLTAIGLPVVFGFVALSVDMARLGAAQTELEFSADSVAHAALIAFRDGASDSGIQQQLEPFYAQNSVDGRPVAQHNMEVTPGHWDFSTSTWTPYSWGDVGHAPINAMQAVGGRTQTDGIPMFLTPFFGVDYINAMTEQGSIAAYRPTDLVVVLDVTHSFAEETQYAKQGTLNLLDLMAHQDLPGNRVGLITFAGAAQVFTPLLDPTVHHSSLYDAWSGNDPTPPHIPASNASCEPKFKNNQWVVGHWSCVGSLPDWQTARYWSPNDHGGEAYGPQHWESGQTFTATRGIDICSAWNDEKDPKGKSPNWYPKAEWALDMVDCLDGGGGTNWGAGLEVALDELLVHGDAGAQYDIALITDGEVYVDTGKISGTGYEAWDMGIPNPQHEDLLTYAKLLAEDICSRGMELHGLFFSSSTYSHMAGGEDNLWRAGGGDTRLEYQWFADYIEDNIVCDRRSSSFTHVTEKTDLAFEISGVVKTLPVVLVQ